MTSNANVLRSSFAQSTRGIRSFFDSFLTPASASTLAPSSPAWGTRRVAEEYLGVNEDAFQAIKTALVVLSPLLGSRSGLLLPSR